MLSYLRIFLLILFSLSLLDSLWSSAPKVLVESKFYVDCIACTTLHIISIDVSEASQPFQQSWHVRRSRMGAQLAPIDEQRLPTVNKGRTLACTQPRLTYCSTWRGFQQVACSVRRHRCSWTIVKMENGNQFLVVIVESWSKLGRRILTSTVSGSSMCLLLITSGTCSTG